MALVQAKCTNCGANLEIDNSKDAAICQFCGTPFIVEKAINNYNTTNNIKADVVNVYGGNSADFVIRAGILEKYNGQSPDVVIPNNVTGIASGAFYNCKGLKSVVVPESVTYISDNVVILNQFDPIRGAFEGCSSLTSIVLPNSLESIGTRAFMDCSALKKIVLPNKLTLISCSAFVRCVNLSEISIPRSLKVLTGFAECTNLKKIDIPNTVTEIGIDAFQGCSGLTEVIIPDTVCKIDIGAFSECEALTNITIPAGVKEIKQDAFRGCRLDTLIIKNANTIIKYDSFNDVHDDKYNLVKCIIAPEEWKRKYYNYFNCLIEYYPVVKKRGCYVATAVYGSYDCPQVWTLRRYRDYTLAETWHGRAFIHTYYAISPTLVKWFGNTTWFKKLWRGKLDKMVKRLNNDGVLNTPYEDRNW